MTRLILALATAGLFAASTAGAAPCTGPAELIGTSSTEDVTLNDDDSTECEIVDGNSGQGGGSMLATGASFLPANSWTELYHQDTTSSAVDSTGPVNGITFSDYFLTFASGNESGTFGFSWSGGPASIDFLFSMHAGGTSGYYLFDNVLLSPASGNAGGTWEIQFLNNGGNTPAWSNGQFWARPGETVQPQLIPEPLSLWLVGIALVALAATRRRR